MMDFMKKLNPFKRHRQPQQPGAAQHHQQLQISDSKRKAADKELQHLNQKIEKILANLDENEAQVEFSREEECVVCLSAKATMKTYPCGHCVVCRLCFVKTIQSAVTERRLPLKCVVCRTKILKLKQQRPRPSSRSRSRDSSSVLSITNTRALSSTNPRSTSASATFNPIRQPPPLPRPTPAAAAAATAGATRPTATKLMQPLLIYPATRPDDPKRRPGIGWTSPSAREDGPIPEQGLAFGAPTAFRHRTKAGVNAT